MQPAVSGGQKRRILKDASHQNKVKAIIKASGSFSEGLSLDISDVVDTKPNYFALDERDLGCAVHWSKRVVCDVAEDSR